MRAAAERRAISLDRSAVARYIQLATLFRGRIESGIWPIDQQIPTVDELAVECGVARMTIRQALNMLEADGLIERFRAKGTFVRKRPGNELWCSVRTDWSGMLLARDGARIELLDLRRGTHVTSRSFSSDMLAPSYLYLRRRHWRDEKPFLLTHVHVDERWSDRIPEKDYTSKTAFKMIADIPGLKIGSAHQTLTIGTADLEISDLLHLPLNAPIAYVQRRALDEAGCLVFVADGIYRGDVVRLDTQVR